MAFYGINGLDYRGVPFQPPTGSNLYADQITTLRTELEKLNAPTESYLSNIQLPEVPQMTPVTYEPGRERSLTQSIAAPRLTDLNFDYQRALNKAQYEPSPIRAYTLREALAGKGQGMGNILAGAASEARRQYNAERATEQQTNLTNFSAALERNRLLADIKIKEAMQKEQQRLNLESAILGYKTTSIPQKNTFESIADAQASLARQMEMDRTKALNYIQPKTSTPSYNDDADWAALIKEWG